MTELTIDKDEKRIILALSSSRTYRENTVRMIKEIQKQPLRIIVICINQPASFLIDFYTRNGIETSRICFIDAITLYATGVAQESTDTCKFVSKPNDLTALSIAVTTILKQLEKEKTVIFLDSINAMLVHSSSIELTKFIHFLISKLRIMNIAGILLAVEKGLDPVLISQLTTFSDEVVEFDDTKVG